MPQRQHDALGLASQRAKEHAGTEMPNRVRIVGAVQRHVAHPQCAESEHVGELGRRRLLAEVRDDLAHNRASRTIRNR